MTYSNSDSRLRTGFKPRKESMQQSYARRQREKGFPKKKAVSTLQKRQKPVAGKPAPKKGLRKVGKRGKKRQEMNAQLNKLGIQHCEIRREGCWGHNALTWAHSKKSRFLVTDADWLQAARACVFCHDQIESMPHAQMLEIVCAAISKR